MLGGKRRTRNNLTKGEKGEKERTVFQILPGRSKILVSAIELSFKRKRELYLAMAQKERENGRKALPAKRGSFRKKRKKRTKKKPGEKGQEKDKKKEKKRSFLT